MTGVAQPESRRVVGLDGIRGLAALFVVVHHCWLMSFHGYPSNTGPSWLGFLLYGHFAVVVFITLSGFSLAIGFVACATLFSLSTQAYLLGTGVATLAPGRAWAEIVRRKRPAAGLSRSSNTTLRGPWAGTPLRSSIRTPCSST